MSQIKEKLEKMKASEVEVNVHQIATLILRDIERNFEGSASRHLSHTAPLPTEENVYCQKPFKKWLKV